VAIHFIGWGNQSVQRSNVTSW